mmetsp:Transcript_30677/g.94885  ORF Transcript_30677/g.94885 Transcript_30677/m.94885 type:complete len:332 (+) Transcript_30677:6165-7160(+)
MVECLVGVLRSSRMSIDTSEAAACALVNLLSLHTQNARRLMAGGGLSTISSLLSSNDFTDLLDADRAAQMQAHLTSALANTLVAGRIDLLSNTSENNFHFPGALPIDDPLSLNVTESFSATIDQDLFARSAVMLCASSLSSTRRAACLLLGNLARSLQFRKELGRLGAVEALWAVAYEVRSRAERATALWALSNLSWSNRANQTRCGHLLDGIFSMIDSVRNKLACGEAAQVDSGSGHDAAPIYLLECACAVRLVANTIHFHDSNRNKLERVRGGVETLMLLARREQPPAVRKPALRSLACLTTDHLVQIGGTSASALTSISSIIGARTSE